MKRSLKTALIAILGALTLACTVVAAACVKPSEPEKYTVTVTCDETQGSATVTPPASGDRYEKGEDVTLTVTPNDGYEVASVTVNGTGVTLVNSAYTFSVASDTQINVLFAENGETPPDIPTPDVTLTAEILATVQGAVTFDGQYTLTYTSSLDGALLEDIHKQLITSFGDGAIWVYEKDNDTNDVLFNYVVVNREGNAAIVYHTPGNTLDYYDLNAAFEDSYNPFDGLQVSDFVLKQNGVYKLADSDKAQAVAYQLSGYNDKVTELTIRINETGVIGVNIFSDDNEQDYGSGNTVFYDTTVNYTMKDQGTGNIPAYATEPYPHEAEHEALKTALENAQGWNNYTVNYSETADGEQLRYNIYVTDKAVYADTTGYEGGFLEKDGNLFPFTQDVNTNKVILSTPVNLNLADVRASFAGFAAEMFVCEGNGVYTMHPLDYYVAGDTSGTSYDIAKAFAEMYDFEYAKHAVGVKIVLKDGVLNKVTVQFRYAGGGYTEAEGLATYEYTKVGETTLPVDTSGAQTVFEVYAGDYYGKELDGTVYRIQVTSTAFILTEGDKQPATVENLLVETLGDETLISFVAYGHEWHMFTNKGPRGDGFTLFNDMVYAGPMVTLLPEGSEECDEGVPYPKSFYGTFKGTQNGVETTIVINASGITITEHSVSGETEDKVTVVAKDNILYSTLDGICLEFETEKENEDGETETLYAYYFILANKYNSDFSLVNEIIFHNEDDSYQLVLARDGSEEPEPTFVMPAKYLGVFTGHNSYDGHDYEVEITADGITVKMDSAVAVSVDFTYDSSSDIFRFEFNGKTYAIYNMSGLAQVEHLDAIQFEDDDNYNDSVSLTRKAEGGEEQPSIVPERFLGTYEGGGYTIVVEPYKLTITHGGNTDECEYTKASGTVEVYFMWNGYEYSIYDSGNSNPASSVALWSTSSMLATLNRKQEGGGDITIPSQYYGTYTGTYSGSTWVFNVTASGITVTVDGTPAAVNVLSADENSVNLTIDGVEFIIRFNAYIGHAVYSSGNQWLFDIKE